MALCLTMVNTRCSPSGTWNREQPLTRDADETALASRRLPTSWGGHRSPELIVHPRWVTTSASAQTRVDMSDPARPSQGEAMTSQAAPESALTSIAQGDAPVL